MNSIPMYNTSDSQEPADFKLVSEYEPAGDQPEAIQALVNGLERGERDQVLLGVTGSGKTFTMAQVIQKMRRPALIMAPNKILAAQLYGEMKAFFPENAVEYFVSYYDYYQPEAYIPRTDTYIEKDSAINEQIDRMRHSATRNILERRDVIIVASVSCLYGLGSVVIEDDGLVLSAYQRSSDANLGLPADIYHLFLIARQIDLPLKSITLNLGNVHIYENNIDKTCRLLAGEEGVRFDLNV